MDRDDEKGQPGEAEIEKILRRVRALLKLAKDKGATPEEAANAAAKAQALMFKYNLEAARVSIEDEGATGPNIDGGDWQAVHAVAGDVMWRKALLSNIAWYNFGRVVFLGRRHGQRFMWAQIISTPENRRLILELHDWLSREVQRMSKDAWAAYKRRNPYSAAHWLTWQVSYKLGAVDTITSRLEEQRKADEAAVGNESRALIVLTDQAIEEVKQRLHPKVSEVNYSAKSNQYDRARLHGRMDAHSIQLKPTKMLEQGGE